MQNALAATHSPLRRFTMIPAITLWLALVSMSAVSAGPQEQPSGGAVSWQGMAKTDGEVGKRVAEFLQLDRDGLALAQAGLELRFKNRDFKKLLPAVNAMWISAAHEPGYPGLVAQAATLRAQLLVELGNAQEAKRVIEIIWPTEEDVLAWVRPMTVIAIDPPGGFELNVDALKIVIQKELDGDGRGWLEGGKFQPGMLDWAEENFGLPGKAVFPLVAAGVDLGLRGVPSLVLLSLLEVQNLESRQDESLARLTELDSSAAARICVRWLRESSDGFRFQVLELFRNPHPLRLAEASSWNLGTDELLSTQLRVPEWMEVLEILAEDPRMERAVFEVLEATYPFGGLTPGLLQRIGDKVATAPVPESRRLLAAMDAAHRIPPLIPVYERGLESPHAVVRLQALRLLCEFPLGESALHLADDPDGMVRLQLAMALKARKVEVVRNPPAKLGSTKLANSHTKSVKNVFGPAFVSAWQRLLRDSDAEVRSASLLGRTTVVNGAFLAEAPLPFAIFETGLASTDPIVRVHFAGRLYGAHELSSEETRSLIAVILEDESPRVRSKAVHQLASSADQRIMFERLLPDDSPVVIEALDIAIDNMLPDDNGNGTADDNFQFLFEGRFAHPVPPFDLSSPDKWAEFWDKLGYGRHLASQAASVLLRWGHIEGLASLLKWVSDFDLRGEVLTALSVQDQARLFVHGVATSVDQMRIITKTLAREEQRTQAAMRSIILDRSASLEARIHAGSFAMLNVLADEEIRNAMLEALSDPTWARLRASLLGAISFMGADQNAFLIETLAEGFATDDVALLVAGKCFDPSLPGADLAAKTILDRFLSPSMSYEDVLINALGHITREGAELGGDAYLARAISMPNYAEAAVGIMGQTSKSAYLELLGSCLLNTSLGATARHRAASGLVRYGPPARKFLVEAILTSLGPTRRNVLSGLELIDEWEARNSSAPGLGTRDEAIAELLRLFRESPSPAIRAEAIRGIATFGAIEAIPLLIPLLEDENEIIQSAAKAALARLHDSAQVTADTETD